MSPRASSANAVTRRHFLMGVAGAASSLAACQSAVRSATAPNGLRKGGIALVGVPSDVVPRTLFSVNGPAYAYARLFYNTLTELDHTTLRPIPALATSWELSKDSLEMSLQLRKDVIFHSGRPFGADDVIAAIKNVQDAARGSQLRSAALAISDLSASGTNTVRLRFAHPLSNIFDLFEVMWIADKDSIADTIAGKSFNGTGPFKLKSNVPGQSMIVSKNTSYWKSGRPYLDGVEVRVLPQAQAIVAALLAGQLHFTEKLIPSDVGSLRSNSSFVLAEADNHATNVYLGCNLAVPPMDNRLVRQAVAFGVNREAILKQMGNGSATSIPWSKNSPAFDTKAAAHYAYNPQRAKELLKEAGVSNPSIEVGVAAEARFTAVAEIVQFNLQEAGFNAKLRGFDVTDFFQRIQTGRTTATWVSGHNFSNLHPATLVTAALPYNAQRNSSNFKDAAYAELANNVWTSVSEADLKGSYKAITDYLVDQQFVVELINQGSFFVRSSQFNDVRSDMFGYVKYDDAFLT